MQLSTPITRLASVLACALLISMSSVVSANAATVTPTQDNGDILSHVQVPGSTDANVLSSEAYVQARAYVAASKSSWDLMYQHDYWLQRSAELSKQVDAAQYDLIKKRNDAKKAQEKYQKSLNAMAELARSATQGNSNPVSPDLALFMDGPDSIQDVIDAQKDAQLSAQLTANTLAQADSDGKAADRALDVSARRDNELHQMILDAESFASQADDALRESQAELTKAKSAWTAVWVADPKSGTSILNAAVVNEWNDYLDKLNSLGIKIPSSSELSNTNSYPSELSSTTGMYVLDTTGVAMYKNVVVPSSEAITRTSTALSRLGVVYEESGDGASSWGCQPFISTLLGDNSQDFNAMFSGAGRQNLSVKDSQAGDIVFFADPLAGIHQAGVYVFGGIVVDASAASGRVSIDSVGADAIASVRPLTSILNNKSAPAAFPNALDWQCGGIVGLDDGGGAAWIVPVADYTLGVHFKGSNSRYAAFNGSPGLEFVTATTQPVKADFGGTVIEAGEDPQWGVTVVIQHGDGGVTRYSSLASTSVSPGAEIAGGAIVGTTGSTGAMAIPGGGVLVSMSSAGTYFDPENVFFAPTQGQYANGQVPANALCPTSAGGLLRCDAARAFEVMNAAYTSYFGVPMVATDTYRALAGQIRCTAEKGDMCAVPGTSNHGWGLAIDFGDEVNNFGTAKHIWMIENSGKYGWYHPSWAQQNGSKPEPWHWEYIATK